MFMKNLVLMIFFFNEVYNPNVREIRRDFSSAAFIVLYNDIF